MITCDYNQPTQELHFREKKSWLGQKSKFSMVTQLARRRGWKRSPSLWCCGPFSVRESRVTPANLERNLLVIRQTAESQGLLGNTFLVSFGKILLPSYRSGCPGSHLSIGEPWIPCCLQSRLLPVFPSAQFWMHNLKECVWLARTKLPPELWQQGSLGNRGLGV